MDALRIYFTDKHEKYTITKLWKIVYVILYRENNRCTNYENFEKKN